SLADTSNEAILPENPSLEANKIPSLKNWDLSINTSGIIRHYDYGYITINDNITLINNDNLSLPIFRFAIPQHLAVNLVAISAGSMWEEFDVELNSTNVEIEYQDGNFTYYIMALNPVVNNDSLYKIQITQTYLRPYEVFVFVSDNYPYNGIVMNVSRMPFLSLPIQTARTTFLKADETGQIISSLIYPNELATIGDASVLFNPIYNVPAYNFSNAYESNTDDYTYKVQIAGLTSYTAPIEATNYKRTITIDNWYYAHIQEEIEIENFGIFPDGAFWDLTDSRYFASFALTKLYIGVDNAENVKVYDEYGSLPPNTGTDLASLNRINIYLRYPVFGGGKVSFNIDYTLKLEDMLQFDKNEFILDYDGIPEIPFHVRNYELILKFPQGSSVQYALFGDQTVDYEQFKTPVFLRIGQRETISFSKTNLTSFENVNLRVGYYMSDLAYFIQPLVYSLIAFFACLLYIGARTLRKDVIEKVIITSDDKDEVPIDLIQDFVEKYEEKTAIQTRITELDESRRKKKVKAKEYDKQRKILESKLRDTIKTLDTTKRALKEQGRKYRDSIQKIEVSEEKRISVERSISDLRIRYIREKAISKDAYIRILRDYKNQIGKFERDIDREIINLRLLIEHESKS
ncbi:MAG: hypothetical protein ACTSPM_08760, partial [Candidatus Heimdallarchaeota archaeon]